MSKLYIWNEETEEYEQTSCSLVQWIAEITRTNPRNLAGKKLVKEETIVSVSKSGEIFRVSKTLVEEKEHITPCEIYGSMNMGVKAFVINWCSWNAGWQFYNFRSAEVTWNSNRGVSEKYIYALNKKAEELRTFCAENAGKEWKVKFL